MHIMVCPYLRYRRHNDSAPEPRYHSDSFFLQEIASNFDFFTSKLARRLHPAVLLLLQRLSILCGRPPLLFPLVLPHQAAVDRLLPRLDRHLLQDRPHQVLLSPRTRCRLGVKVLRHFLGYYGGANWGYEVVVIFAIWHLLDCVINWLFGLASTCEGSSFHGGRVIVDVDFLWTRLLAVVP